MSIRQTIAGLILVVSASKSFSAPTIISGSINRKGATDSVSLYYYATVVDKIESNRTFLKVPVQNHSYRFNLDLTIPVKVFMQSGQEWLTYDNYVAPGDSLVLSFIDNTDRFDGTCGDCNGFLVLWAEKFMLDSAKKVERQQSPALPLPAYIAYLDKIKEASLQMLQDYNKNYQFTEGFKEHFKTRLDYEDANSLLRYSWNHPELMNDPAYLAVLHRFNFDNPKALNSDQYINFLRELPYSSWRAMAHRPGLDSLEKKYYFANQYEIRDSFARRYFSGSCYDAALYHILNERCEAVTRQKSTPAFASALQQLSTDIDKAKQSLPDGEYYSRLKEKVESLNATKKAPEFILSDITGKKVQLSDFKGKVIYIDFWATNCIPCREEIPYVKALQNRFAGQDVVFIFVSVGDTKDKLVSFLKSKDFYGQHLIAPEGYSSEVARQYKVNSLPKYVLVNRDGTLATENAPRPSMAPDELLHEALQRQ